MDLERFIPDPAPDPDLFPAICLNMILKSNTNSRLLLCLFNVLVEFKRQKFLISDLDPDPAK